MISCVFQASLLSKKGSQHSKYAGRSKKHYGIAIHYPVVFLVRLVLWVLGSVPMTPEPNISFRESWYKWKPQHDGNGWFIECSQAIKGHIGADMGGVS